MYAMALRLLTPHLSSAALNDLKHARLLLPCPRYTSVLRSYHAISSRRYTAMGALRTRPATEKFVIKQSQVTLSSSVGPNQCWSCQSVIPTDTEFCLSCKSLQPLNKQRDYFTVLGIQKNFSIDTKALAKRFRMLQAQYHPDRYTLNPEREQQFAHDHSSAVNKAYQCLLHPVDMNLEFLMAVMEMNEELAEAEDKDTIQAIRQRNMTILDSLLKEADAAFSSNDINTARVVVAKIKYYNSIYEKVKALERKHGIVE
ncbi:iron-sulfur cluster co-chaperone protein HscB-like isoform X6 [Eriocheir sinensis]|uniref:iron-sulfur cluster co-chaperone protein HscB-like isoform X6 n=1 Tax=Eriocheir sinensis TaxID=95602 RepID=UPI0021C9380F|nr:iron-sulfur cluster co-chaperone protein HscB-like isoform X6 [Eriocheir sinensis]